LKGSCSGFKLIVNLSLNIQEIMIASGQLLLNFITFWSPSNVNDLRTLYRGLGTQVGFIIRKIINYNANKNSYGFTGAAFTSPKEAFSNLSNNDSLYSNQDGK
jgi:hypothetical protein